MKIQIIEGTTPLFYKVSTDIVDLYNAGGHGFTDEKLTVKYPELIAVVKPEDSRGGIVINRYRDNEHLATILFAAFPEEDRNKGYLKACLESANQFLKKYKKSRIVCVELNLFDNSEVWEHLGFTYHGTVNFVKCLFNDDPENLFDESVKRSDGLSLADLMHICGPETFKEFFR